MLKLFKGKFFSLDFPNLILFLFLGMIIGFLPLIVYIALLDGDPSYKVIYGEGPHINFFYYYRSLWLYLLVGFSFVFYFLGGKKIKCSFKISLLFVFAFFVVASNLFCQFKIASLFGSPYHCEGTLTLLAYLSIAVIFSSSVKTYEENRFLLFVLFASSTLMCLIGLDQIFGNDFIITRFHSYYLVPEWYRHFFDDLNIQSMKSQVHSIYTTLGNTNHAGSYMAMLFVLTFTLIFYQKSKWSFYIVPLNWLIFVNLLGSRSRAGLLGGAVGFCLSLFFLRNFLKRSWIVFIATLLFYALSVFCLDYYALKNNIQRFLGKYRFQSGIERHTLPGQLDDLKLNGNNIFASFDGTKICIFYDGIKLSILDKYDNVVPYVFFGEDPQKPIFPGQIIPQKTDLIKFPSDFREKFASRSGGFQVAFPKEHLKAFVIHFWPKIHLFRVSRGSVYFYLCWTSKGFKILDAFANLCDIDNVPSWGFKGAEGFASGRGYIWSRAFPLLKNALFFGYGPDSFAIHFPNNDLLGRLKYWGGGIYKLIDKPHNMYLQIAFQTGFLSLLVFCLMLFVYFYETLVLNYFYVELDFFRHLGLGIALSLFAYLFAAFFNDSTVAVAPVFWSLLGWGWSINQVILEETTFKNEYLTRTELE